MRQHVGCMLLFAVCCAASAATITDVANAFGVTPRGPAPAGSSVAGQQGAVVDYPTLVARYQYATVPTCENPSSPPFLKEAAHQPQYFANVQDWKGQQWVDYVSKDLKDKWVPSAVFTGIGAVSLLILLVWRGVHCCMRCCGPSRSKHQQFISSAAAGQHAAHAPRRGCMGWWRARNSSKAMMWLKPFVLLLALVSMALIIYGLSQASKGLADGAWNHVDKATNQVNIIAFHVENLLTTVSTLNTALNSLQWSVSAVPALAVALKPVTDGYKNQLNDTVTLYRGKAREVRNDIVGKINNVRYDRYQTTQDLDRGQYIVTVVLLCVGLLFLVLLLVAMALNVPGLFTVSTIFSHIMLVLYFVVALLMAMALSSANDLCPATETIVKAVVPGNRQIILNYYMFNVGGTVQDVLKASGIIDLDTITQQAQAAQAILDAVNSALRPFPDSDQAIHDLKMAGTQAQQSITASLAQKDVVISVSSYQAVNPLYMGAKRYACCDVRDTVLHLWSAFTGAAWVMMVMSWLCNALITEYDKAPGNNTGWCGCTRLGPFDLPQPSLMQQQLPSTPADLEAAKAAAAYPTTGYGTAASTYNYNYPVNAQAYPYTGYDARAATAPVQMSQYPVIAK